MAVNGLSGYTSPNSNRITGLASNMDTETLVKKAMQAETAKYDKILQKREIDEWKIESYRDVTSTLQSFYKEYFDVATATKKLKSADTFASFTATYGTNANGTTTATDYVSVTPGAGAKAGTYTISDIKLAASAIKQGGDVSKSVVCSEILDTAVTGINGTNCNNTFRLTLNGTTKTFSVGNCTTVAQLQDELQKGIDANFGTDSGVSKIKVNCTPKLDASNNVIGGTLSFAATRPTDSFSIGTVYNGGANDIFNAAPTIDSPFTIKAGINKFDLTIGGVTKTVTVPQDGTTKAYTNVDNLLADIKTAAKAIPEFASASNQATIEAAFTKSNGRVIYSSAVAISSTDSGANAAIGVDSSNMSNKIDLNAKIFNLCKNNTLTPPTGGAFEINPVLTGSGDDIIFSINNQFFRFNSKQTSINDIIKAVNGNTKVNATMKYDVTTNSFKVQSNATGAAQSLTVTDQTGDLMQALKIETTGTEYGKDARVTLKDASGTEITIVRPTNSFIYDGLTYNVKNEFTSNATTDPIKVTVSGDTTKTYDFIKTFVDKYNEIIGKLNDKISEKRYKDYAPLTSDQESSMTEEQIKKWETKAKSGLIKNDSIITDTLSKLRTALYASVEGTGVTLSSIGITTSTNYEDKGKLVIDEVKLKKALVNNPEEVSALFTNNSDITYSDAINSTAASSIRSQRYKESGIAQRLSDIIQDAIRTNTDVGNHKGSLLEKAGIVGDRSEYSSFLSKEILQYDNDAYEMNQKLIAKENALYKKYAAMESALNKLNAQQSNLAQMLGQ